MARPVAERAFDQDALSYGYGVIIEDVDGHTYLAHDNDSLQNGPYRVNRSGNGVGCILATASPGNCAGNRR